MTKAHEDLEIKTSALNAELQKVQVSEASTQTVSKINEVSNVQHKEGEYNTEENKN